MKKLQSVTYKTGNEYRKKYYDTISITDKEQNIYSITLYDHQEKQYVEAIHVTGLTERIYDFSSVVLLEKL